MELLEIDKLLDENANNKDLIIEREKLLVENMELRETVNTLKEVIQMLTHRQ